MTLEEVRLLLFNRKNGAFKNFFGVVTKADEQRRQLEKLRRSYIKERTKQRDHLKEETEGLTKLLKEGSIDQETFERLKKILEISYRQKREKTRKNHGFSLIYCVFRKNESCY
jgi:Spy/CpxP family protein refolding chaperone